MFFRGLPDTGKAVGQVALGGGVEIAEEGGAWLTPEEEARRPAGPGWTRWDTGGVLSGLLLMVLITVVTMRGRIFWEDEMLGWMLLRDPTWRHMVAAWKAGADGGGFLFYLIGRGWFRLFGASDVSFRLYSTTCVGLAFAVTWAGLRRYYGIGVTAFAVFNVFLFARTMSLHLREGRFYGLLVLGVALTFLVTLMLAELRGRAPAWAYAVMFAAHGMLTTSHLLGAVYSGALLLALVVLDGMRGRWRPLLYAVGAASWLLLLPERANIAASAAVGKPHFWVRAPGLWDVVGVYTGESNVVGLVLIGLAGLVGWGVWRARGRGAASALRAAFGARRPVYVAAGALLLVPGVFLAEGLVGTWLFNNRYLLPVLVGVAYLTAELTELAWTHVAVDLFRRWPRAMAGLRAFGVAGYMALMLFWGFHHVIDYTPSARDYTGQLTAKLPHGVPVVCEDAFSFTELIGRQHASGVRYMFLLDWDQTIGPSAPPLEVTQYHLMEIWRKVGYFSGSIEPLGDFLATHDRFLVLHTFPVPLQTTPPEIGNPLVERFRQNPAYEVRPYAAADRKLIAERVFLVCRGGCDAVSPGDARMRR